MWVFHNHDGVKRIHEKGGGVENVGAGKRKGAPHWNPQLNRMLFILTEKSHETLIVILQ